jgi:hypothetical protein
MAELRKFEFVILRYAPSVLRDECVNFGLVMFESDEGRPGFAAARFARNWERVLQSDRQADIEILDALKREIQAQLGDAHDREMLIRRMEDSFSGVIQVSQRRSYLSATPEIDIEEMAGIYLEAPVLGKERAVSERQRIVEGIGGAFEAAGIAKYIERNLSVAPYTKMGDPFHFDFGYRAGKFLKLFHAVPFKTGVDQAMLLAARYPEIAAGIQRVIEARPSLTAVVDDGLDRTPEPVQFALSMLEEQRIRVASVAEMAGLAEMARQELLTS